MSKSRDKGTAAEREVVRYLQNWWPAAERRALSGNKDKGDVAGIPGVVIEVKAAARLELAAWKNETLNERINAQATRCVLVVKRARKPVGEWDAWIPVEDIPAFWRFGDPDFFYAKGANAWARMDLALATALLKNQGF